MTTLTQASIISRKTIRYTIFGIIFLIVARFALLTTIAIYKKVFPAPPPPPTVTFGRLTKIPFPERQSIKINFQIETAEGGMPTFPEQMKVYFMPKVTANLLSLDYAREKASRLQFLPESTQVTESVYRFNHKSAPATMETDIITGAFSISYDLNADPTPLSVRPPQPEVAANSLKSFLEEADLLPDDLTGPTEHKYLKTQGGIFISALSQSDANIVKINLFRKTFEDHPSVTKTPDEANVWFYVSGLKERGKEVIAGQYRYFPVDESQSSTYPIKTGDAAWQELTSGNYFPASYGTTVSDETIKIRKVYLAYYDAGLYTEFFQPVYVFEGDKNFVAYVPAVTPDYYGE